MVDVLSRDNPRLIELTEAYSKINLAEPSLWKTWANNIDIQNFRGEVGYMAQMWSMTEQRYQNTFDYAVSLDMGDLLVRLGEDGAFGAVTFERDGFKFGRDLLDSAFEIKFIQETIGIPLAVLDIGAGYGRLLHRLSQENPAGMYMGIDGVPLSTFLCEYYVKYRGCDMGTLVVPLNEYEYIHTADLAINTQSFSEMPLSAVEFWIKMCADMEIRYFFLEPHSGDLIRPHYVTNEPDGTHKDYYHLFAKYGYNLMVQQPKFPRDLAPQLIYSTDFLMFKRG